MRGGLTLIENFVAETNSSFLSILTNTPIQDPNNVSNPDGLVWGVPVVVGAKKGFPNFNKFVMQTSVQISRNLQIKKTDYRIDPPVLTQTNQQLYLGVSNRVALEAWNSYASTYNKSLRVIATNFTSISLTNQSGGSVIWPTGGAPRVSGTNISQNLLSWPSVLAGSNAYYLPIATNSVNFISDFQVTANGGSFTNSKVYQTGTFPIPAWNLVITNRLLYVLIDTSEPFGRVIDFVNISDLTNTIDVAQSLIGDDLNSRYADQGAPARFMAKLWDTNRIDGTTNITVPTKGVDYQISVSREDPKLGSDMWDSLNPSKPTGPQREEAVDNFLKFMEGTGAAIYNSKNQTIPPVNSMQTPFNPALKFDNTVVWAINDPLVHYMSADLKNTTNLIQPRFHPTDPAPTMYLRQLSERYRPWGGNRPPFSSGQKAGEITDESAYDFTIKDPRVRWSDDWDFPTNKFPSIGWLGRVHRGTPWQTIYLKAGINEKWFKWAGNFESHPTNDWKLADIFTASANDNAARGLLSINQTNKAAWSAVLSGIIGLRNILSDVDVKKIELFPNTFTNLFETPAPVLQPNSPELLKILEDVNRTRQTGFGGVYQSLGQILAVPSLSVGYTNHFVTNGTVITTNQVISASPFLNVENDPNNPRLREAQRYYGVTDEAVERIPRQIMSLLKLGEPRFVVYCYGQSLKPANNSLVLNAPANSGLFNLCTNYQITGEIVTRTLLRVEASPDAQHPKTVIESYNILQE
jgi:hypothetical protein